MSFSDFLKKWNLLSNVQLQEALQLQNSEKTNLENILIAYGYTNNLMLYKCLAQYLNLEFVDITKSPVGISLLKTEEIDQYLKLGFLPYRKIDGKLIVLTSQPPQVLQTYLNFPTTEVTFKITSPHDIRWAIESAFSNSISFDACNLLQQYSKINIPKSYTISRYNLAIMLLIAIFSGFFYKKSLIWLLYLGNLFYLLNNLFKFFLTLVGILFPIQHEYESSSLKAVQKAEESITENSSLCKHKRGLKFDTTNLQAQGIKTEEKEWPIYTILIPLYQEQRAVDNLINALDSIDYPKARLDVKFILEADDLPTIDIKSKKCPCNYEIIIVPFSLPRTKAKACNYAIRFAKGKYITIFDAEDIPEKLQLKKAYSRFESGPENLACLQANLFAS